MTTTLQNKKEFTWVWLILTIIKKERNKMINEILKTIYGTADFCYVTSPDVGFGSNQYKVTLRVNTKDALEHIKE